MFAICAEIVARLAVPYSGTPRYLAQADQGMGYRLTPGFVGREREAEFDTHIRINSKGFRDTEVPRAGADRKIVGLGDSFTFGAGVAFEETYLAKLEQQLNTSGVPTAISKQGIPGFNIEQESRLLEETLAKDHYDLILLGFGLNDVTDIQRKMTVSSGYLVSANPTNIQSMLKNILIHSAFVRYVYYRLRQNNVALYWLEKSGFRQDSSKQEHPMSESLQTYAPSQLQRWRTAGDAFERIRQLSQQHHAELIVLYLPYNFEVYPMIAGRIQHQLGFHEQDMDIDKGRKTLAELCQRGGVPFLDLTIPLRQYAVHYPDSMLYYPINGHWTKTGHALAASILFKGLLHHLETSKQHP